MALDAIWTAGAERDLLEIYAWLFEALPDEDDLIDRLLRHPLRRGLDLLPQHPEAGTRVKGGKGMRRWLLGPQRRYALFYAVEGRRIAVHALVDLRQNPEAIWKRLR